MYVCVGTCIYVCIYVSKHKLGSVSKILVIDCIIKNTLKSSICVINYAIIILGKNLIFACCKALYYKLYCDVFSLPLGPKFVIFGSHSCSSLSKLSKRYLFIFKLETRIPKVVSLKPGYLIFLKNSWHMLNYQKILFLHSSCKCRLYFQHRTSCFLEYKENGMSQILI